MNRYDFNIIGLGRGGGGQLAEWCVSWSGAEASAGLALAGYGAFY